MSEQTAINNVPNNTSLYKVDESELQGTENHMKETAYLQSATQSILMWWFTTTQWAKNSTDGK